MLIKLATLINQPFLKHLHCHFCYDFKCEHSNQLSKAKTQRKFGWLTWNVKESMLLKYLDNKNMSEMLCFLNFLLRGMLYDLLQP